MSDPITELKHCLLRYPAIYSNIAPVLHHIFLVIGNGYKWVNGELVCDHDHNTYNVKKLAARGVKDYKKQILDYKKLGLSTIDLEREIVNYKFTVKHIDEIVTENAIMMSRVAGDLYPLCKNYARNFFNTG